MGKTSFALNVALNVAKAEKKTVAVFSLEMSREQLATRLLSSGGLRGKRTALHWLPRETDWEKIAAAAGVLNKVDIRIDDNPMLSVADMNAKCRRIDSLGLVVIDYLQLMTSAGSKGGGESRQQVVSDMSRMLKIMAKELNVPVICLSQLSRANEKRDDKRPMLSDLRESGAIEQDADIVLFLYRDDYYNEDSKSGILPSASWRKTATAKPARWSCGGCRSIPPLPHWKIGMTRTSDLAAAKACLTGLCGAEAPVLAAVSGGLDSMCLLHLLATWGRERNLNVAAAHFNHQLRGAESDRDERFVRDWCGAHEIPFVSGRGDVRALAARKRMSLEEAAREARYAFLNEQKTALGCRCVLTAHHADDNAETMLLNLLRGTGLRGSPASRRNGRISCGRSCK